MILQPPDCITVLQLELTLLLQVNTFILFYSLILFLQEVKQRDHGLDHLRELLLVALHHDTVVQVEYILTNFIHFLVLLRTFNELYIMIYEVLVALLPR